MSSPSILRLYPALPYSAPLADALEWAVDKAMQGLASLALLLAVLAACFLASAPYRWLIGAHVHSPASPTPAPTQTDTPAQLEDGAPPPEDAASPTPTILVTGGALLLLFVSCAFLAFDFLFHVRVKVLAPAHSVVFAFTVFALAVWWVRSKCGSGEGGVCSGDADAGSGVGAPAEVLFDATLAEGELKTCLEKDQAEKA
ncbi:hypothetical protein B0H14DRAFT_3439900 [Mycena olivaceomarginata]|nr:hypothetical protein B0H14DRAFT_3439900 [Mycena olivaceomarginata]